MNNNENDVTEIDLLELFFVLWSRAVIIILVVLFTAILGFMYSYFLVTPQYESTTKIYILNKNESSTVTYSDVQLGTQLTKDYKELINSRYVLEEVINSLGLDTTYDSLKNKINVTTPSDTRIVSITVTDPDAVLAMNIANAVRETASAHIENVMDIDAVNVVETANMPTEKASPSYSKFTLIGGVAGAFLVCVVVIIGHLMDDTIKTSEDVERYLGLSTLGTIPIMEDADGSSSRKKKKKNAGRFLKLPSSK